MKTLRRTRRPAVSFNTDGEIVCAIQADEEAANIYVTVGDGFSPSDPTSGTNDGSISGRFGVVNTGVTISPDNTAFVKAVAADADGNLGPVVESQKTAEARTKTLRFMATLFQPVADTTSFSYGIGTLIPNQTSGPSHFRAPVVLPDGVNVVRVRGRMGRNATSDTAEMKFYRIADSGTATLLATLTHSGTGASTVSDTIDEDVSSTQYVMTLELESTTSVNDAFAVWFEVQYTNPTQGASY